MSKVRRLIFQLGTNNWQRGGEYAPGSGILHESHHLAYNDLAGTASYSMYPSSKQTTRDADVRVFELEHDIPICESISPTSSYRWHSMSDEEFAAYRTRLTREVLEYMNAVEREENAEFSLAVAHHSFLNPLVLSDVLEARVAEGKRRIPLLCFVHGTALKMFAHEKGGRDPEHFPERFLPMMRRSGVFDYSNRSRVGVDLCAAISNQQIEALAEIFPEFPRERVVLSPNGYNHSAFRRIDTPTDLYADRDNVLAGFTTAPYEGSSRNAGPVAIDGGIEKVVIFCGKFADWKRLDCVLQAAVEYEKLGNVATLVVGSGPHEDQVKMQDLAYEQLGLRNVFFLGPRPQDELAVLYNTADVGCFPSYKEPFGLVFIECMACGTPVIGADSGGPRDFVSDEVGALVPETDDRKLLADSLAATITRALGENWKQTKGANAQRLAESGFSVRKQCENLLAAVDRLTGEN